MRWDRSTPMTPLPASLRAGVVTPLVHQALQHKLLLPATHLVDAGSLDAELLATSWKEYAVDLLGPVRPDVKWQARAGEGFDAQSFAIFSQKPVRENPGALDVE